MGNTWKIKIDDKNIEDSVEKIGKIITTNSGNFNNTITTYSIINSHLGNYFRLKEVDFDKIYYSDIYYNKCENEIEFYEIYNLLGQKIEEVNLPSGIYIKKYKNKVIKIRK